MHAPCGVKLNVALASPASLDVLKSAQVQLSVPSQGKEAPLCPQRLTHPHPPWMHHWAPTPPRKQMSRLNPPSNARAHTPKSPRMSRPRTPTLNAPLVSRRNGFHDASAYVSVHNATETLGVCSRPTQPSTVTRPITTMPSLHTSPLQGCLARQGHPPGQHNTPSACSRRLLASTHQPPACNVPPPARSPQPPATTVAWHRLVRATFTIAAHAMLALVVLLGATRHRRRC